MEGGDGDTEQTINACNFVISITQCTILFVASSNSVSHSTSSSYKTAPSSCSLSISFLVQTNSITTYNIIIVLITTNRLSKLPVFAKRTKKWQASGAASVH